MMAQRLWVVLLVLVACAGASEPREYEESGGSGGNVDDEPSDNGGGGGAEKPASPDKNDARDAVVASDGAQDASTSTDRDGSRVAEDFDWHGIIGTGQSLSVGAEGAPPILTSQPYANLKLALDPSVQGPPFDATNPMLSVVSLVEPIRPLARAYPGFYPHNIYGESPHTAMANQMSAMAAAAGKGDFVSVHTVVGEAGQGIKALSKDAVFKDRVGAAYAASLFEVKAFTRLANAKGKRYGVTAIVLTHGETDWTNPTYEQALLKLWRDYNADLPAITGQTAKIPVVLTQQQGLPTNLSTRPLSTLVMWRLCQQHPGDFICVGPKYQYSYASDRLHLTNAQYDRLGEKYGQVIFKVAALHESWKPLQPETVTQQDNMIRANFFVPVPPLAWDTDISPPHQTVLVEWRNGRGFEVEDGQGRVQIVSATFGGHVR
ncbi:MAG: dockerin [Deltaproteobacteria bacterium]|nr:dockerin [Deltaproteobacteria bacterium]